MNNIITQNFETPYGEIILGSFCNKLCLADWVYRKMRTAIDNRIQDRLEALYETGESDIIELAKTQLTEYFSGARKVFEIPLLMVGTDFQQKVWNELLLIHYGKTSTYLDLSRKTGNEKSLRAVASANGANAISIIIPCHRVIGSDGSLTGYAGGTGVKQKLLELENPAFVKRQFTLFD
ncbi:MAG: methylated-DNA--[protein]-cysteine S-methyltransferase [Bacteroidales bacterium]|nr:methylated-DNA--[protein]-cysteine S-methyltransferase [Bacteroidales bacterium]